MQDRAGFTLLSTAGKAEMFAVRSIVWLDDAQKLPNRFPIP